MICPYCQSKETKVTDKRDVGKIIRRRRECLKCSRRFSTHENVEIEEIKIIKKSGEKEPFDRVKLTKGIMRACEKRPVTEHMIEKMVDKIEEKIRKKGGIAKSLYVGEQVSNSLKRLDNVSYIRFASVYRDFADISDFKKEIKGLIIKNGNK